MVFRSILCTCIVHTYMRLLCTDDGTFNSSRMKNAHKQKIAIGTRQNIMNTEKIQQNGWYISSYKYVSSIKTRSVACSCSCLCLQALTHSGTRAYDLRLFSNIAKEKPASYGKIERYKRHRFTM